jgi:Meiotically up-regulated gene 113
LRQSTLAQWVLRTLINEGPQDFANLFGLLKSDPDYGHLALNDSSFEAKLRTCLSDNSFKHSPLFVQTFGYKWGILKNDELVEVDLPKKLPHKAWIDIGRGSQFVYIIFPQISPRLSFEAKSRTYPIKIGRTNRPISERLLQLQTGSFLDLQVGLLIRTNNAVRIEAYLHDQLSNRKMPGKSSQSEWFQSSIDSVISILRSAPEDWLSYAV